MNRRGRKTHRVSTILYWMMKDHPDRHGFALPMAFVMALIILTLMGATLLEAHSRRDTAQVRQTSGASAIVTDSAIARVLVELSKPENSSLLARNFDPINPDTGQTFLGVDGIVNSGDETGTAIDQWTGYDPSAQSCTQAAGVAAPTFTQAVNRSGAMGNNGSYRLLAYRYDPTSNTGTVLVRGEYQQIQSHVQISISVEQDLSAFPGIGLIRPGSDGRAGVAALRGRQVLGPKANIYFPASSSADPSINGASVPTDADRNTFLNAIWSSTNDGNTVNSVQGKLTACNLNINIPQGTRGTNFGVIDSPRTFAGQGAGSTTLYQLDRIDLDGNEELIIDTTAGPVQLEFTDPAADFQDIITLRDNAKILNIRTDGQPPQVGDARLIVRHSPHPVTLYNQSCIQNVFLYSFADDLRLFTTGPGCPGGLNTNFEGVVWAEAILSSKNDGTNRDVVYYGENPSYDTTVTPGATSGIAVPDDVSSLTDLLQYTQFPLSYRYGQILNWQQVRL